MYLPSYVPTFPGATFTFLSMHFHPIRWEVKFRPKQFCRHFTTSWNRQKFSSNGSWGEPWRGVGAEGVADLTLPSLPPSFPPSLPRSVSSTLLCARRDWPLSWTFNWGDRSRRRRRQTQLLKPDLVSAAFRVIRLPHPSSRFRLKFRFHETGCILIFRVTWPWGAVKFN